MESTIDIVLPAFCLIGFGYILARTGYLGESVGDGLADFVFKVAVPVLLMRSIATADFSKANPWIFVLVYFAALLVTWFVAALFIRFVFRRGSRASIIGGIAAAYSNLVLLGIPLVDRAYGVEGLQILLFLMAVHLPVMMTLSTFLMEYAVRQDGVEEGQLGAVVVAKNLALNLAANPIVIGIFIGIGWRMTGLGLGGAPKQVLELLAATTGPMALMSLGMSLIKYEIRGNLLAATGLAALNLFAMPAMVYFVATTLLPLPPLWLKVAILVAACPTGVNAYLIASYFKIAQGLASSTIVIALLGSLVTIPLWLLVI